MRIGLITAFYDEKFRGNEYYLAKHLSKMGHEVFIYVSKYSVPRYGMVKKTDSTSSLKNVYIRRMPSFGFKRKGMIFLFGLKKQIENDKLDAVHLQEWFMPMGFQLRKNKNLILTQRAEKLPFAVKVIYYFYGKKLLENAKAVTALTMQAKSGLVKLGLTRDVLVVPNGVDTEIFRPERKIKNMKRDRTFTILYAGRLSKEKGVDVLLRACQKLNFAYELNLLGEGEEERRLKEMASQSDVKAFFLGSKPHEELCRYYSNADVLVIPSLIEPFGFVMLEALSCGTPVIGSDIGGIKDVINEKVGIKTEPGNAEQLAEAIIQMREKAGKLAKNCRKYILKNYSWKIIARKYLKVYK